MFAGCELPLAAVPAEAWADTVSAVLPVAPDLMTTLGVAGAAGWTGFGAGASKKGCKMGAGSAFLTGAAGVVLAGAGFFLVGAAFLVGTGFFLAGAGFFLEAAGFLVGAGFLADAFLGAGFLAMMLIGSELFQFLRD